MGYAQLVIGPAGSGKSTYCSSLYQHCESLERSIHIVNLDPAAENFNYPVAMDIRELISLDDVMEELGLGPNGGLMYWLTETNKRDIENCLNPEPHLLLPELNDRRAPRFEKLNKFLIELVDHYRMVSFISLDLRKESSIQYVLAQIDNCIQYGEDSDVKIRDFDAGDDDA